jgi:hypothetical protein
MGAERKQVELRVADDVEAAQGFNTIDESGGCP